MKNHVSSLRLSFLTYKIETCLRFLKRHKILAETMKGRRGQSQERRKGKKSNRQQGSVKNPKTGVRWNKIGNTF